MRSNASVSRSSFQSAAKEIEIKVKENRKTKVNLKIPIRAIYDLENLMEEDLKKKLADKGVDYKKVIADYLRSSGEPQNLFFLEDGNKSFSISSL